MDDTRSDDGFSHAPIILPSFSWFDELELIFLSLLVLQTDGALCIRLQMGSGLTCDPEYRRSRSTRSRATVSTLARANSLSAGTPKCDPLPTEPP